VINFELHPRLIQDTFHIANLTLCRVVLMNDSNYPWLILIPCRNGINELYELSNEDRLQLVKETDEVAKRMSIYFQASKMNVAALGNIVPQLHVHVIARKDNDISWPNPVWNNLETKPYIEKDANILIMDIKHLILDLVVDE